MPPSAEQLEALQEAARAVSQHAYAPYSKYRVGSAVLTDQGVFTGANVENAVSNLGICAERVALAQARIAGARHILAIAVHCADAHTVNGQPTDPHETMPCGACRQWIHELAPDAWIITNGLSEPLQASKLLPQAFQLPDGKLRDSS